MILPRIAEELREIGPRSAASGPGVGPRFKGYLSGRFENCHFSLSFVSLSERVGSLGQNEVFDLGRGERVALGVFLAGISLH